MQAYINRKESYLVDWPKLVFDRVQQFVETGDREASNVIGEVENVI